MTIEELLLWDAHFSLQYDEQREAQRKAQSTRRRR